MTAGAIGLIVAVAVAVDIAESSIVDVPTAPLAIGAFALLYHFHAELTVLLVVLGCCLLGAVLQLTII